MILLNFNIKIPNMQHQRTKKEKLFTEAISKTIRKLREQNKKSLNVMAFDAGLAPSSLSRMENNLNTPQIINLYKIAKSNDLSLSDFIKQVEKELPYNFSFIED
jgi:transcriptional regulator with XRE-family HTH domain